MALTVINKQYTDLLSRTGSYPKGNALDAISLLYEVEIDTVLNLSAGVSVLKSNNTFTLSQGNWSDLIAASAGANVKFMLAGGGLVTTTVVFANGADMTLAAVGGYADGTYSSGTFEMTDIMNGFDINFNLPLNSDLGTAFSLIDGSTQSFSVVLVNALTIGLTDTMLQTGDRSGGSTMTATVTRNADATSGNQVFQFDLTYEIWVVVDPTHFLDAEAIGDYFEVIAQPQSGDPSVTLSVTNLQIGNTGLVGENLNGMTADYTLDSIVWTDNSANVMEAFDANQPSNFSIVISRTSGNFTAANRFNAKFLNVANDPSVFSQNLLTTNQNLTIAVNSALIPFATPTNINSGANADGAAVTIKTFNVVNNTTTILVTGSISPNTEFTTMFNNRDVNDRNYKFWIQCVDNSISYNRDDTVNVLIDDKNAIENIEPLGPWTDVSVLTIEDHDSDLISTNSDIVILEDDLLATVEFALPKTTIPTNPYTQLTGRIVAEKTDGTRFILEEFIYDVSQLTRLGGDTIPFSYSQERVYKFPSSSDKSVVSFALFPSLDTGTEFGVQLLYGFRAKAETWVPLAGVPDDFLGQKTNNWFPYSDDANWQLKFEMGIGVIAHTVGATAVTPGEYINDYDFDIRDYNDWAETPGTSIVYKRLDDTVITRPISGEIIKVLAIHDLSGGADVFGANSWGQIRVRPKEDSPLWMSSTVLDQTDSENALTPSDGETKCTITLSGANQIATLECLFDFSKIDSTDYTFSTRIQDKT